MGGGAAGLAAQACAGADMISIADGMVGSQTSGAAIRGAVVGAVQDGRIPQSRIEKSYGRIMALRAKTPG